MFNLKKIKIMFYTNTNTRRLDNLIKDAFKDWPLWTTTITSSCEYHSEKTDEGYVLELPVVGLTKEDLVIKISNEKLEIRGGKEDHRWCPPFEKVFTLPKDVNPKKVDAKVENGLLTLTIGISKDSETIVKII